MNNTEGRFKTIAVVLILLTRKNKQGATEYPESIIDSRMVALDCFRREGVFYQELGW